MHGQYFGANTAPPRAPLSAAVTGGVLPVPGLNGQPAMGTFSPAGLGVGMGPGAANSPLALGPKPGATGRGRGRGGGRGQRGRGRGRGGGGSLGLGKDAGRGRGRGKRPRPASLDAAANTAAPSSRRRRVVVPIDPHVLDDRDTDSMSDCSCDEQVGSWVRASWALLVAVVRRRPGNLPCALLLLTGWHGVLCASRIPRGAARACVAVVLAEAAICGGGQRRCLAPGAVRSQAVRHVLVSQLCVASSSDRAPPPPLLCLVPRARRPRKFLPTTGATAGGQSQATGDEGCQRTLGFIVARTKKGLGGFGSSRLRKSVINKELSRSRDAASKAAEESTGDAMADAGAASKPGPKHKLPVPARRHPAFPLSTASRKVVQSKVRSRAMWGWQCGCRLGLQSHAACCLHHSVHTATPTLATLCNTVSTRRVLCTPAHSRPNTHTTNSSDGSLRHRSLRISRTGTTTKQNYSRACMSFQFSRT